MGWFLQALFRLTPKKEGKGRWLCRKCGRRYHGYIIPRIVRNLLNEGATVTVTGICYDCFCDRCQEAGLPDIWALASPGGRLRDLCREVRGVKRKKTTPEPQLKYLPIITMDPDKPFDVLALNAIDDSEEGAGHCE